MKNVNVELYCRHCGHEERQMEFSAPVCPKCGSTDIFNSRYIICDCGETVYLNGFTNECAECGALYNISGQELAPPDEWDAEDRYACFGPQEVFW